jgi:hypothetical protein
MILHTSIEICSPRTINIQNIGGYKNLWYFEFSKYLFWIFEISTKIIIKYWIVVADFQKSKKHSSKTRNTSIFWYEEFNKNDNFEFKTCYNKIWAICTLARNANVFTIV